MGEERTEPVVDTEQGKAPEPAHQDSCRDRIRNWWATTQARWFSKVGATIATNPLPFIAIPVLLFIAFGFGITNAKLTTDAMELWVQKGSRLEDELDFYEDYFYGLGGYVAVQATPKQEGDNMMDRKYLDEMYAIDAELLDMRKHRNPRWEIIGNCATTTDAALCNDLARPFCGWDEDTNTCIFMDGFGLFPSYLQKQAITIDYLGVKWGYRELCEEVRVPTPTATNQSSVLEAARTPCSKQFTPQDCFAEHPYTQQAKTLNLLRWPENHPYSVDDAATLGKAFAEPCKMWQESFNSKGYVLGNPEYTEAGDEVTKISAYKWLYPLYEEKGFADKYNNYIMKHASSGKLFRMLGYPETISEDQAQDILEMFEEKVNDRLYEFAATLNHSDLAWLTPWQIDDRSEAAALDNQSYVIIGLCLLLIVVWILLFRVNHVSRRLFLGLFGVLGIGLAVWATLGFASLIGMSFNGMSLQVLPYVSMGLGIDDMFVMLHYFPEDPTESVVARMTKCYGHAGPSITATSIINTIVFFVGASIPVSAVRDFAIQAGISVILNYTIIIFGFGGMLVYDARRIKRGACDVCICIESSVPYKAPKVSYTQSIIEFVMRPITSNIPVQVVLMLITLTIVGVSLWVASDLELGLPFSDFIGDSGIEKKYLDERTEYFRTEANNVFGRGAQWHLRENQIKLYQLIGHDLNNPNNPWKDQIKGKINTAESTYLVGGPAWVFPFRRYALQYPGAQAPENDPCSCYPATQPVATAGRFVLYDQVLGISEIPMNCTIREDMFYDLLLLFTGKKTFLDDGQTPEDQMINPSDPKYYPRCVGGVSDTSFVWETPTIKEVESALVPLVPGADEVVYVKGNANFPFGERVPSCPTTGCDDTCPAFATSLTITVSGAGYIQDQDFLRCGACQSPQFAAAMNATLVIAGSDVSLTYTPNLAPAYNLTTPSQTRELWHAALKNTVFLTLSDANVRKEITFSFAGAPTAVPATCEYASQTVFGIANKIFLDPTGAQFGYGTMSVYADQISWTSDWEMVGFKVSVLNNPVEQSDVEITLDMMQENRDLLDNYGIDVFATGQSYMLAEQYRFSKENTRNLIIICLCCAFVLMTLLMASVVLAAIMTVVMGMSMIVICASLEMLDLQLNGISMMSILFGIGINVELCVHICRAFLVIRPALSDVSRLEQNRDRVGFALSEMSVPVFDGAFTSFMGVLVLAFADIPFFRKYFFQFYSMLILISLWHAFIPLPILLCYLGPDALPPKVLGDEEMEEARSKAASEAAEEEARERELADHEP